jgi:hypothetical protein
LELITATLIQWWQPEIIVLLRIGRTLSKPSPEADGDDIEMKQVMTMAGSIILEISNTQQW